MKKSIFKLSLLLISFCLAHCGASSSQTNSSEAPTSEASSPYLSKVQTLVIQDQSLLLGGAQAVGSHLVGGDVIVSISDLALQKLNLDGSPQQDFGQAGLALADLGGDGEAISVLLPQEDGKILAGGISSDGSNYDFALSSGNALALARFESNGQLDTSFGKEGGLVFLDIQESVNALALKSDGKLLIATRSLGLLQYDPQSGWDDSFVVEKDALDNIVLCYLLMQEEDQFLAAGYIEDPLGTNGKDFVLLAFHSDGSLRSDFGSGGKVVIDFDSQVDIAHIVKAQSDGSLLIAGQSSPPNPQGGLAKENDFALSKVLADGSVDLSFGKQGKVLTDLGGRFDVVKAIELHEDGVLTALGFYTSSSKSLVAAQYEASGNLLDIYFIEDFALEDIPYF
ncbi:MAG: hypothetical protein KDK66_02575 [Deltaproteobacteria bacterium]|nr:hypothetical protein [Deltaproteobacteria bacterium]